MARIPAPAPCLVVRCDLLWSDDHAFGFFCVWLHSSQAVCALLKDAFIAAVRAGESQQIRRDG